MKKKILIASLCLIFLMSNLNFIYANEKKQNEDTLINSGEALRMELINSQSTVSVREIMNNATENAKHEYFDLILEQAENVAKNHNFYLNSKDKFKRNVFSLDKNVSLTVELGDFEEDNSNVTNIERAATSGGDYIGVPSGSLEKVDYIPYRTIYKNYGNRYFTSTYTFAYPSGWVKIITENHYNISDSGLKARYGVTSYTYEGGLDGFKTNWEITDGSATSEGTDINIVGMVEYIIVGPLGTSKGPRHLRLDTRVRLDHLDKANKRAKITEHAYFYRTKTIV